MAAIQRAPCCQPAGASETRWVTRISSTATRTRPVVLADGASPTRAVIVVMPRHRSAVFGVHSDFPLASGRRGWLDSEVSKGGRMRTPTFVSMSTLPSRFDRIGPTIESLLRGSHVPDKY